MLPATRVVACAAAIALLGVGCRDPNYEEVLRPYTEAVLTNGMVIRVQNRTGLLAITGGSGTERSYVWGNCKWNFKLVSRTGRFYGKLGLYRPGDLALPPCEGFTRAVVEESQLHFASPEEAVAYFSGPWYTNQMDVVYNHQGLVVGWAKAPSRRQINVDIFQIMIAGHPPTNLPGARDDLISISTAH